MRRFDDRVAIVTGGASGIGLATSLCLAAEGARVVIADWHQARAVQGAEALLRAGAVDAMAATCNVALEPEVLRVVDATFARFHRLDVVVNSAGVVLGKPIPELTEADLLGVLRVDFLGAFWFTKQVLMRCDAGAAVVNVASVHAHASVPLLASHAAAKAALLAFTRSAAIEGRARGIRVNAVLPGAIATPMLQRRPALGAEPRDERDVGRPEDVAAAIAFLASDEAAFVNGAELCVDGGRHAMLQAARS